MPAGSAACGQAKECYRNDIGAKQRHQLVCGAYEFHACFTIGKLVAHDFRNGKAGNGIFQGFLQALGQLGALSRSLGIQTVLLAV